MTKFGLCLMALSGSVAMAMPAHSFQSDETAVSDGTEANAATTIVCRREPPPTGSRIGSRRICKTQHEWDIIDQELSDVMDNAGNRNRMGNEGAGFCTKRTC